MIINILTGGSRIEWARGRVRTSITLQTLIRPNIDLWTGIMEATLCERELRNSSLKAFSSSGLKCRTIFGVKAARNPLAWVCGTTLRSLRLVTTTPRLSTSSAWSAPCVTSILRSRQILKIRITSFSRVPGGKSSAGMPRKMSRWVWISFLFSLPPTLCSWLLFLFLTPWFPPLDSLLVSHPLLATPEFSSCFLPPALHPWIIYPYTPLLASLLVSYLLLFTSAFHCCFSFLLLCSLLLSASCSEYSSALKVVLCLLTEILRLVSARVNTTTT